MIGLDVFLRDEVQELIDALAHTFRVKITLFSPSMEELRVGLQNPGSPFCQLIQGPLGRLHQCRHMDKQMCHRAEHLQRTTYYRCHAGLLEAALPIQGRQLLGYLMVGQFRDTPGPQDEVEAQWQGLGADPSLLKEAFQATPFIDSVSREKMLTLASMLVTVLVSENFLGVRTGALMSEIASSVQRNLTREARIGEIARELGKGVSTVAHEVKAKTGMTFTRYVQTKRVEHFESLLRTRADLLIQQAALQAGFTDPLYFSRVYRKIRGKSPSRYRSELLRLTR